MVITFDVNIQQRRKPNIRLNLAAGVVETFQYSVEETARTYIPIEGLSKRISLGRVYTNFSTKLLGAQFGGSEVGVVKLALITNEIKFIETLSQRVNLGSALLSLTNTIDTEFVATSTNFLITQQTPLPVSLSNDIAIKVGNPVIVGIDLTASQLSLNNELRFGLPSNMEISEDIDVP